MFVILQFQTAAVLEPATLNKTSSRNNSTKRKVALFMDVPISTRSKPDQRFQSGTTRTWPDGFEPAKNVETY